MQNTIHIAGAGLSGLTAAIVLARAGYAVRVYERNGVVGKRFNEDYQGLMNWGFDEDVLRFMERVGIETSFWHTPVSTIDVFGPDNFKFILSLERPLAYLVQRGREQRCLDQSLLNQAVAAGAEIVFNTKRAATEVDIVATGPKFDGIIDGLALGYTFESDSPDVFCIMFDDRLAPKGYSYFFLLDGRGTVATCILGGCRNSQSYLKKTVSFVQTQYGLAMRNKELFAGTGNFYMLKSDRRYTGEAGGFLDFLWGFGMRYALITGYLAAQSIIEKRDYQAMWKAELGGILETSVANRFWFSRLGRHSYKTFIRVFGNRPDPLRFFTRVYRPNIVSRMLFPIARLRYTQYVKDRTSGI